MATNNTTNATYVGIGSTTFTVSLLDNPTASAFHALLPLRLQMSELNGNEKYADLSITPPTAATNPGTIRAGDLMLYGSRTLVLWYEDYSTSYSYTRIGSIDNPAGLAGLVGRGSVEVRFATDVAGVTTANNTSSTSSTATVTATATAVSSGAKARRTHVSNFNKKLWLLTSFLGVMFMINS